MPFGHTRESNNKKGACSHIPGYPTFHTSNTMSLLRKLVPLADRVLIRRVQMQTKTTGGILLPEAAQSQVPEGEVIAAGPGRLVDADGTGDSRVPMQLKVGDKVLLPQYGGTKVEDVGDEDYDFMLFREDDILGKFEG